MLFRAIKINLEESTCGVLNVVMHLKYFQNFLKSIASRHRSDSEKSEDSF